MTTLREDLAADFAKQFPATLSQYSQFKIVDWFLAHAGVAATPLTVCSLCLGTGKVFHENPPRKDTPYSRCHCQVQGPNQPAATPQVPWKGNLSVDLRKGALSVNADGVTLIDEAGVCWAIVFPDKGGFYEHAAVIATPVSRPHHQEGDK